MARVLAFLILGWLAAGPVMAAETRLAVRALTLDAKFIGTSMAGMAVTVADADTGEVLDRGVTSGTTGNTDLILRTPKERYGQVSTEDSAVYVSTIDIDEPRRVRVTVRGPIAQPQTQAEASSVRWVLPGKHVETGDGWLLVVPGFAVDVLAPGAHTYVDDNPATMRVEANVVMICGCPTEPDGTWDSNFIDVEATLRRNGETVGTYPMSFTGTTSRYAVDVPSTDKGMYDVLVTAFDARTGNAGVDRTSFVVR
ncbi:MAG: hypothetical protein V2J26_13280 [Pacificimonas sp.]|jgi:hypothetical protein|nr:hypothetical protein [Pacificimonas sp.]